MITATGNMFSMKGWHFVTTNNCVTKDGRLVMGAGAAKSMKDIFPDIDLFFARQITRVDNNNNFIYASKYGLLVNTTTRLGAFQTKYHFKDKSDLELIRYSTAKLILFALANPTDTIHLNFPGIGYGGLKKEDVLPIITALPDNVIVWTL